MIPAWSVESGWMDVINLINWIQIQSPSLSSELYLTYLDTFSLNFKSVLCDLDLDSKNVFLCLLTHSCCSNVDPLFPPSPTQNVALSLNDLETLLGNPDDDESVWSFYRTVSRITETDRHWWWRALVPWNWAELPLQASPCLTWRPSHSALTSDLWTRALLCSQSGSVPAPVTH